MQTWTVYILRCADGTFYTGITSDLARRLQEHNEGKRLAAAYTRGRRPVCLVYREKKKNRSAAQKREAELKRLSRQEKIAMLQAAGKAKV
ncbi:MAG TPA: GIY-YIG nuclease family protein [Gammaproteobacteria bacterium]|nr:GIY-YIG nuclease family protein [Gammaproteobacteria bacterium]